MSMETHKHTQAPKRLYNNIHARVHELTHVMPERGQSLYPVLQVSQAASLAAAAGTMLLSRLCSVTWRARW